MCQMKLHAKIHLPILRYYRYHHFKHKNIRIYRQEAYGNEPPLERVSLGTNV